MTDPRTGAEPAPADIVAAAVLAVPGVTGLHAGAWGEAATYLPHRRVPGVQTRDDVTEVHVTVIMGADIPDVARQVRDAVGLHGDLSGEH